MRSVLCFMLVLVITGFSSAVVIRVPRDQPTIQAGINAASNGDTVLVADGTYYENVIIDKSLTLAGENGGDTIIEGQKDGDCLCVTSDNVSIKEFTIRAYNPPPPSVDTPSGAQGVYGICCDNVNFSRTIQTPLIPKHGYHSD